MYLLIGIAILLTIFLFVLQALMDDDRGSKHDKK